MHRKHITVVGLFYRSLSRFGFNLIKIRGFYLTKIYPLVGILKLFNYLFAIVLMYC